MYMYECCTCVLMDMQGFDKKGSVNRSRTGTAVFQQIPVLCILKHCIIVRH